MTSAKPPEMTEEASAAAQAGRGQRFYRPELDALRFAAFFCVFCGHLTGYPAALKPWFDTGGLGVAMFFLLSAYLIVTLLELERERTGTVSVRAFAARRVLRIGPLYLLAMVLAAAWPLLGGAARLPPRAAAFMLVMAGNVWIHTHFYTLGVVNQLWSVSVEEQFYAVIPWFGRPRLRRWLPWLLGAALAVAYARLWMLGPQHPRPVVRAWTDSWVMFQFFAAGGLIALWHRHRAWRPAVWLRAVLAVVGAAACFVAVVRFGMHSGTPVPPLELIAAYALALPGVVLLFFAVLGAQVRWPAGVLYLGRISYGLYVFHSFALALFQGGMRAQGMRWLSHGPWWLSALLALGLTTVLAALSYHFFELPILRVKQRFEAVPTRLTEPPTRG